MENIYIYIKKRCVISWVKEERGMTLDCEEGIKIVSLSCALGKMDIWNCVHGVFQSERVGGRVCVVCEGKRYEGKMFVSLSTLTLPHTHTHRCLVSCVSFAKNYWRITHRGLCQKNDQKIKILILIQHCTIIHVPNSVHEHTFTYNHFPLPSWYDSVVCSTDFAQVGEGVEYDLIG